MKGILFLGFIVLFTYNNHASAQLPPTECKYEVNIGSGRSDGLYYEFVESWAEFAKNNQHGFCIKNNATQGSVENLDLIHEGEVEFAVVQGDIGHHTFYGRNGYQRKDQFLGLKPLFREYVQIVVREPDKNNISAISSLEGKRIAAGSKGSGGYWNAIDLLDAANLYEGFNYQFYQGIEHPIEALGKGNADAAIFTSARAHKLIESDRSVGFSYVVMPKSSANKLSIGLKKPYYDHGLMTYLINGVDTQVPSISVHAYLVVNKSVDTNIVELVNSSIDKYVAYLKKTNARLSELDFIQNGIADTPFDIHYIVSWSGWNRFVARILNSLSHAWFFLLLFGITTLVIVARLYFNKKKYNSIGVISRNSLPNRVLSSIFIFSKYAVGIAVWLATLLLSSRVIVWQEERYASAHGIESPLKGFDVIDSTIWLVKTAFTTLPGEIPLSLTSSMLIPATVLLGLGAFLHPVHVGFSAYESRKKKILSGEGDYSNLENHVVICGWNERNEGVIYSLISKYTPTSKTVVVVADIGGGSPLLDRGFESKRVLYVKGDAANTDTLRRAGAGAASEAIVMACDSMRSLNNKGSILTVVALRSLSNSVRRADQNSLFICAELIHGDNESSFSEAGVDAFVKVEDISNKVAAANTISNGVSDFIIDFLTFDNHFEIYTKQLRKLPQELIEKSESKDGIYLVDDMRSILAAHGFQLFGKLESETTKHSNKFIHCNGVNRQEGFGLTDRLVFFSVLKNILNDAEWSDKYLVGEALPDFPQANLSDNVVIIGGYDRAMLVKRLVDTSGSQATVVKTNDMIDLITQGGAEQPFQKLSNATHVLVLEDFNAEQSTANSDLSSSASASLIIRRLDIFRQKNDCNYTVSSETRSHRDRELFLMAGAKDVIVRNSLIERLLVKMVFNHGRMYEVIDHIVALDNGEFLESYEVKSDDVFDGLKIVDLFVGKSEAYQVIGWLPGRMKSYNTRDTMGISTHWITAFNSGEVEKEIKSNPLVEAGDFLMVLRVKES